MSKSTKRFKMSRWFIVSKMSESIAPIEMEKRIKMQISRQKHRTLDMFLSSNDANPCRSMRSYFFDIQWSVGESVRRPFGFSIHVEVPTVVMPLVRHIHSILRPGNETGADIIPFPVSLFRPDFS